MKFTKKQAVTNCQSFFRSAHQRQKVKQIKIKAANDIKRMFKGYKTRQKYVPVPLLKEQLTDYKIFVESNEPDLDKDKIPQLKSNDKVLIVGTSGLNSVEIACMTNTKHPKILLIDNSQYVVQYWKDLQKIIGAANSVEQFKNLLRKYYKTHAHFSASDCGFQEDWEYIEFLIDGYQYNGNYGFEKIKSIILHASIIQQSWGDEATMQKIINLKHYHGYDYVIAYPSNIAPYLGFLGKPEEAQKVRNNVSKLNADLIIESNLDPIHRYPTEIFYLNRMSDCTSGARDASLTDSKTGSKF